MATKKKDKITILEGLEPVRQRPGMYIGSTGRKGLHHLVWEVVDNSIDEAMEGFASDVDVIIKNDGYLVVKDNGRGIPIETHSKTGKSSLEAVLTILHAGGKFDTSNYKTSGGLHGVGVSVVNALSSHLIARVYQDGFEYKQEYKKGKAITDVEKVGKTKKTGTTIEFLPDDSIFKETTKFSYSMISNYLMQSSFLNKGIRFNIEDERNGKTDTFYSEKGLVEYIEKLNEGKNMISKVFEIDGDAFKGDEKEVKVDIAFAFNSGYSENIKGIVNSIETPDGGSHINGFRNAMVNIFNDYAKSRRSIKTNGIKLTFDDIKEGLTAIVSVKLHAPEFEGQTKTKLGNTYVSSEVNKIVSDKLLKLLKKNREDADRIIDKAVRASKARKAAKEVRDMNRKIENAQKNQKALLPGTLADSRSKDNTKTELFLVEGDSAGGSAKKARDTLTQAVLPLRGKILNTQKVSQSRALKDKVINDIVTAIGAEIGDDFDINKSRYSKIILMTDADVDGAHITMLLLTFFYNYMRPLLENGMVYLSTPPLYRLSYKDEIHYFQTEKELENFRIKNKKNFNKYKQSRFKGLGEMNPIDLKETTMDISTRKLLKVTLSEYNQDEDYIILDNLMGKETKIRKELIREMQEEV